MVVVMTTQWRAQATGYGGDGNATTPVLDALAESSIDFVQAVTPHPFGVFARAAFLTGEPCPENGISDYYDPLPPDAVTLAHRYREKGYDTAFFGKWQLFERNPDDPVVGEAHARIEVPEGRRGGFEYWEGFESGFLLNDGYYHGTKLRVPTRLEGYQSDVVIDRSIEFLDGRDGSEPLFEFVSLDAPHPPYDADAAGIASRAIESILLEDDLPDDEAIRSAALRELSGYYAHIEATDRAIGRLIAWLKASDEWENTLFVFTSAHGDMHGSHGLFRKGWPHDQSVRVPLLLSWPKLLAQGRRDPLLISLLDLGPTLWGLCFGEPERSWSIKRHGVDLSAAVRLKAEGPDSQAISMPSSPPFEKQCPYAWSARRSHDRTEVEPVGEASFSLDH